MSTQTYSPGLEGVIAGETQLSFVNPERNSLMYRGYDIRDLADHCSFEEVAYLMFYGKLPNQNEYDSFVAQLKADRQLPQDVINTIKTFPTNSTPMDMIKAGVALLSLYDPDVADGSHDANVRKSIRLLAQLSTLTTYSYRATRGKEIIEPKQELGHAANFLYTLNGEVPDDVTEKLFEQTLIAYIDHGFNASTFASRVTTSTLSDIHSGVVTAIGTLKGPLHGGANEEAMKMLLEIGSPDKAEAYVLDALANKKKMMGFGHRAYKTGDPRAFLLTEKAKALCERTNNMQWYDTAMTVRETMIREKNIFPNVDFPTAYIYYVMGLPIEIYTPMFAVARVAGWCSHMIEQLDNNRLIRPKANYEGPQHVPFVAMNDR